MISVLDIFLYLLSFLAFALIQALFINGVYEFFRGSCVNDMNKGKICKGNLGYMIAPDFFEKNKEKEIYRPLFFCPKCMASFWSIVTFFPVSIYVFGFHWQELFIWAADAFILISLNWYVFKKL